MLCRVVSSSSSQPTEKRRKTTNTPCSYVIASFLYYIIELVGGEQVLLTKLREKDEKYGEHPRLLGKCFGAWDMGEEFILRSKYGVLQYVVVKVFCVFLTIFLETLGVYENGSMDFARGYIYVAFFTNVSQMWALYVLVKLYLAVETDLKRPINWHPVGKFLCVKGVVFFTWWQGFGISVLKSYGIIDGMGSWSSDDVADGLQDYLICVEMLAFAIAHMYTFTYVEYMQLVSGGGE